MIPILLPKSLPSLPPYKEPVLPPAISTLLDAKIPNIENLHHLVFPLFNLKDGS